MPQTARRIHYFVDTVCQDYVEGWAIGPAEQCVIDVLLDGRLVGQVATGRPRHDVGSAFPNVPGSANAGFLFMFDERDFAVAERDVTVTLRIASDRAALESEPMTVPVLRPSAGRIGDRPRAPFPASVVDLVLWKAPELATADLASEAGACAAVDVLEFLARRGPRPLPGVHRYIGFLRSVYTSAVFAARYFPVANRRSTGDKDRTSILTGPLELAAIAHHLYVLTDAGVSGVLLEFGCYKGYSTSVLSTACHLLGQSMEVFDSFEGLPATDSDYYRRGEFAGSLGEVTRNVGEFGRPEVVTFNPGFFHESMPRWRPRPVAVLWMDVDLERSAVDALQAFPHLDRRGALFSHECRPSSFDGASPVAIRGPEDVVGPIVDAYHGAGREPIGRFLSGCTGAFWDGREGIPVLPAAPLQRLVDLALA